MSIEFEDEKLRSLKVVKTKEKGQIVKMKPTMSKEEKEFCNFISLVIYSSFKENLNNQNKIA